MLQYVLILFCFLWFIRVWYCLCVTPYRFVRKMCKLTYRLSKSCLKYSSVCCKYLYTYKPLPKPSNIKPVPINIEHSPKSNIEHSPKSNIEHSDKDIKNIKQE